MPGLDDFEARFDEEGRFKDRDGIVEVIFAVKSGARFPGLLHFKEGLCIRVEMARGGAWELPDHSPIDGIRFLLDIDGDPLHPRGVAIDQGRVRLLAENTNPYSKRDFLNNLRIGRNLFVHSQWIGAGAADSGSQVLTDETQALRAVWLTPKSVASFNASDFRELGRERQAELCSAVRAFLTIAEQVPADRLANHDQYRIAKENFEKLVEILSPYLSVPDEIQQAEQAIRKVDFPPWVVNWDLVLDDDSTGTAALWVNLFADGQTLPRKQLGKAALDLSSQVHDALDNDQVHRWPYIRIQTTLEHKAG